MKKRENVFLVMRAKCFMNHVDQKKINSLQTNQHLTDRDNIASFQVIILKYFGKLSFVHIRM